ncbi:MAG: thiamine-phosphate kinase [Acidobacteriota bacterium]
MNSLHRGEGELLDTIRRRFRELSPPPPRGMGDDCAVLLPGGREILVTTDCLIEQEHFRREEPAYFVGRKAIAVNLSDVAAMGGHPTGFLMTLALPAGTRRRYVGDLIEGLASASREHGLVLVGGDLSRSPGPLVISITVFGRTGPPRGAGLLKRSGARSGDGVYVSGPLGGSAAGRLFLDAGWCLRLKGHQAVGVSPPAPAHRARRGGHRLRRLALAALKRHMDPAPRLELGRRLRRIASAAIDLSDGLSIDLARLAAASRVGVRLIRPALPIADEARGCEELGTEPSRLALDGGEDYELLFTVPPERERRLAGLDALLIGRCVGRRQGLFLIDARGRRQPLRPRGFDHFRR